MPDEKPILHESKELVKIGELSQDFRKVNTIVKVVSKGEVRNVTGRDRSLHRVADALVGDETGCVILTLWDENIDKINEDSTLHIVNGELTFFEGYMRLNLGKYGSFRILEDSYITKVSPSPRSCFGSLSFLLKKAGFSKGEREKFEKALVKQAEEQIEAKLGRPADRITTRFLASLNFRVIEEIVSALVK